MKKYVYWIITIIVLSLMASLFVSAYRELYELIDSKPAILELEYVDPQAAIPESDSTVVLPSPPKIIEGVPYIYQDDHYPNGCESVSAVMALQYLSFDISVDEFIDAYLDVAIPPVVGGTGYDPNMFYLGDPRSNLGWGCFYPVIATAIERTVGTENYVIDSAAGHTLEYLCSKYIDADIPVILWATVNMRDSSAPEYIARWTTEDGREIEYNRNLHCVLLVGYDDDYYYVHDPKHIGSDTKYVAYSKAKVENAYETIGMQSIAVYEKP